MGNATAVQKAREMALRLKTTTSDAKVIETLDQAIRHLDQRAVVVGATREAVQAWRGGSTYVFPMAR
jgi:hypothetical protein